MSTAIKVNPFFSFCRVKITEQKVNDSRTMTLIKMEADRRYLPVCSHCKRQVPSVHSYDFRLIEDIPIMGAKTFIHLPFRTLRCSKCGLRVEDYEFIKVGERLTERFKRFIVELCGYMTIKDVADLCGLDWKTVKRIHKQHLKKELGEVDMSTVGILAIDEIAIRKGHNYLTIIIDYESGRILWSGKQRRASTLEQFFKQLTASQKKQIKAIAMDMWDPYIKAVKVYCPRARIVFDQFHVVREYGKTLDKIRNQEFRVAQQQDKTYFKGTKYLLLKNRENLKEKDIKPLEELLAVNRNLSISYILKDDLKQLWQKKSPRWVKFHLDRWCQKAIQSQIELLIQFAKKLLRYAYGIINHGIYPIHTGRLEGINNKIKTLKRQAYGFHDWEYFDLLIKKITLKLQPNWR